jgi:hypothetical protein
VDSLANRHDEALRQWRRWQRARFRRKSEEALFELWQLCGPEVGAAVKKLADRLAESRGSPGSIGVRRWLRMHRMTEEDARVEALPGVWRAAKGYDPAKGTFQTYAFKFIVHEIYERVRDAQHGGAETLPETEARGPDVSDCEESSIGALFLSRARAVPAGKRAGWVSERTASLSSEDLEELLEESGRLYPEPAWLEDPALETIRSALLSQAVRAADSEGKMVPVSDLVKMLRAKEYRQQMKKQYRSNSRLAREFGVSDQTVRRWLAAATEQGVGADDLSLEALDRLARIMAPRRGPRAGRKPSTPKS